MEEAGSSNLPKPIKIFVGWRVWRVFRLYERTLEAEASQYGRDDDCGIEPGDRIETLKQEYAAGDYSEEAFERELDRLLESDRSTTVADTETDKR